MTVIPRLRIRWQFSLLLSVLCASLASAADFSQLVYVGTYTDKNSKGIYVFRFDPATGEAGPVELAAESPNPSFLAVDSSGTHLYAVNEVDSLRRSYDRGHQRLRD